MKTLPFLILLGMLAKGEPFYEGKENVITGAPEIIEKDARTLRVIDPWDSAIRSYA